MYSRFATGSRGLVSSRYLFSGNEFCQEEKNELDSKTIDQEDLPPGAFSHCFAQCTHRPIGGQDRQFIRERFCGNNFRHQFHECLEAERAGDQIDDGPVP